MYSGNTILKITHDVFVKNKWSLVLAILGVLTLGLSQSLLLLAVGPILKYMLSTPNSSVTLNEFIPDKIMKLFSTIWTTTEISRYDFVWCLSVFVFFVVCLKATAHFFYHYFHQVLIIKVIENFRVYIFSKILLQKYESFRKLNQGQWMSLLVNDILYFQNKISEIGTALLRDGMLVLSCLLTLFWLHWPSAIILLLLSPFVLWYMGRTSKNISSYTKYWQKALGDIAGIVLQQRIRFDFIYAQKAMNYELNYFKRMNKDFYHKIRKSIAVRSSFAPLLEFFGMSLFVGSILLFNYFPNIYPPDQIVQIFAALALLFRPWRSIGEQLTAWYETKSVWSRLIQSIEGLEKNPFSLSESQPQKEETSVLFTESIEILHAIVEHKERFKVEFENMVFEFGKTYAIKGASGTGKSSFLKTLAGLYEPSKFNANIRFEALKDNCSYVAQENFLFDASIYENVFYAESRDGVAFGGKEYLELVEICQLTELMRGFGDIFKHHYSPLRSNLSGGQIQRLCLLRALLRKKPIILLDEISSALDVEIEEKIFSKLFEYTKKKNFLVIAVTHRETSMKFFDHIYKMDEISKSGLL